MVSFCSFADADGVATSGVVWPAQAIVMVTTRRAILRDVDIAYIVLLGLGARSLEK